MITADLWDSFTVRFVVTLLDAKPSDSDPKPAHTLSRINGSHYHLGTAISAQQRTRWKNYYQTVVGRKSSVVEL